VKLAQDKANLIEKIIKSDRKFSNNEDLYDDFFSEACRRSAAIIDSIENEATLETYLRRIVTTSIVTVLKDFGRLRRSGSHYMSTNQTVTGDAGFVDYSAYNINYANIDVPSNPEEIAIQKEILEFVAEAVKKINEEEPDEKYLEIYTLRYVKGLTQKEIANELELSQSEICKRLYKLIEKVKDIIEQ